MRQYVYVHAYVRTEINANVFTPLSIQFENLTLCQLRCSDLILTRYVPASTTPNRKMVRRMVIPLAQLVASNKFDTEEFLL